MVHLINSHLSMDSHLVKQVFADESHAQMIYYPGEKSLYVLAASDLVFKSIHKTSLHLLKMKNSLGDKSIALHEMIIDHDLNSTDRPLEYQYNDALKILQIKLT